MQASVRQSKIQATASNGNSTSQLIVQSRQLFTQLAFLFGTTSTRRGSEEPACEAELLMGWPYKLNNDPEEFFVTIGSAVCLTMADEFVGPTAHFECEQGPLLLNPPPNSSLP